MSEGRIFGYARVSTREQNLDRQIDALIQAGVNKDSIIIDKASGKDFEREGYQSFKSAMGLREGDTLIIKSIDRLGRNKKEILHEFDYWNDKGVKLKIMDIPTTMVDFPKEQQWIQEMINNIIKEVYTSIAEQERKTIRQRQAEGYEAARKRGKHLGRPSFGYPKNFSLIYLQWKNGEMTAVKARNILEVKKTNFYKIVKLYEDYKNNELQLSLSQIKKSYFNNCVIYSKESKYYEGKVVDVYKDKDKYKLDVKVEKFYQYDGQSSQFTKTLDELNIKSIDIEQCHLEDVNILKQKN